AIRPRVQIVIGHFARIDVAQGGDRRSLVRRYLGANKGWDCNGRDDQNDRHDNQQFDKRKTLLLFHDVSLRACSVREHTHKLVTASYPLACVKSTTLRALAGWIPGSGQKVHRKYTWRKNLPVTPRVDLPASAVPGLHMYD